MKAQKSVLQMVSTSRLFLYFSVLCFVSLVLIRSLYSVLLCSTAGSYN